MRAIDTLTLIQVDPCVTLIPNSEIHSAQRLFLPNLVAVDPRLTQNGPCMSFDHSNVLHSGHEFFWRNLFAIEYFYMD